ncbi:conserved hypothetical protein [Beggiatoa sp. PS]|nr:conserved hypothetical protein [Beggiatoa sp. PS]
MEHQQLMNLILKELPTLMESHHTFREAIVSISSVHFADKAQTENRFDSMITRLDRSMEKWEEHHFVLSKLTTAFEKLDQRLDQKN